MIFCILLPLVAIVFMGVLLILLLLRGGIRSIKGLFPVKNYHILSDEKPALKEFKTPYKPSKPSRQEEQRPANTVVTDSLNGNQWRW